MLYQPPAVDDRSLWDIWLSVHQLQTLSAAYELEIFETLAAGPLTPVHSELVEVLRGAKKISRPANAWALGQMGSEIAATVSRIMHCHSLPAAIELAAMPELSGVRRLLDVGGGSGVFSIALAQRHPEVRCTVMDLAAVCDVARRYISAGDVADRVDAKPVDMFRECWPDGYDAVFFSNVFHDWNAATNAKLARSAFEILPPAGKILVHEMLLEDSGGPPTTAGFSVRMVTSNQGKQYTFAELADTLQGAGFVDVRRSRAHLYYSLVVGTK
jgi:SAM-dependent methyltransferase